MANEIKLKIKVDDDGSLSIVGKEAGAAADELDELGKAGNRMSKSARNADRNMKGLSKQSANAQKNFSKMQQGMTGGLVPAYAILASNVFALSAAFEFFKRAADLSNLEASQISYAENTGVALGSITQRLRDASGGMLGFKESAQAAAIGMAKGFSPSQLEALAEGARKASVALGRNFEDSFDRLIRGASKAEPELLDELGITLRLEEATQKYAESIGKNRDELNSYQRSQAVLIETQRQLEKNFGGMDTAVNPFVRLQKVFDDIIKAGTSFFLPMFQGIANILAGSVTAAVAAFGLIGLSILKTIVPMDSLEEKLTNFHEDTKQGWKDAVDDIKDYRGEIERASADVASTKAGGGKDMQKFAQKALDQGATSPILKRAAKGEMKGSDEAMLRKGIDAYQKEMKRSGKVTKGMFAKVNADIVSSTENALNRMQAVQAGFFKRSFKWFRLQAKRGKLAYKTIGAAGRIAFTGIAKVATWAGKAVNGAMKMAGIIGIIKLVWDMVGGLMEAPATIMMGFARMADRIVNFMAPFIDTIVKFFLGMGDSIKNTWNKIKAAVTNVITDIKKAFAEGFVNAINKAKEAANALIETFNTVTKSNLETFELTPPPPPEDYKHVTAEVSNMAGAYKNVDREGTRFADTLAEMDIYKTAEASEAATNRLKASASALASFTEVAKKAQESLTGIKTGMDKAETGAQKSTVAFNGLVSLDIPSLFKRIGNSQKKWNAETKEWEEISDMNAADQKSAAKELEKRLEGLGALSPKIQKALAEALAGDPTKLNALAGTITDTNTQLKFFEEGLATTKTAVKEGLAGGDLRAAIVALEQLKTAGKDAGKGIEELTDKKGKVAELDKTFKELFGVDEDSTELLEMLKKIQLETDMIATSQAMMVGYSSDFKTALEEDLAIREKANQVAIAKIQLAHAANTEDKLAAQQALSILEIEKKIAEQRKQKRQSKAMKDAAGGFGNTAAGFATQQMDIDLNRQQYGDTKKELAIMETITNKGPEAKAQIEALKAKLEELDNQLKVMKENSAGSIFKDMAADFAALGPEGALMASVATGMGNMLNAFEAMGDAGDSTASRLAAGFQAASAVLSSVSNIMNAAHKNRMRGIDAEIKAEKKRDGKSKESVAKIKALEAKKEQMARKNFEMNKKMQMAQVMISTAAAIASVWANPIDWWKSYAMVMTPIIAAMGAAQLAMIAGTSFQGGGGSGGAAAGPSSVSVGKRRNTVDMGKSKSARGELAYMRGDQGIGGPENFRSAFYGARHRAVGGNTGYVVGEQGPELFMPDRPGTIVSSDDAESIGAGTNVTFSINAIDAAGVEDVLAAQQGNIIGMIREAANSYGEDFLEDLDESTYTTPIARRA